MFKFKTEIDCPCGASIKSLDKSLLSKFYIFHWNPDHQEMVWEDEMGDE